MNVDPAAVKFVRRGARIGGAVGGLGGAAVGGAIGGLPKTYKDFDEKGKVHKFERTTKQRVAGGLLGAAAGGYIGHGPGRLVGAIHHAKKWVGGHRPESMRPDWLKGIKTKADAKAAFRARAKKLHPDLGGSDEAFDSFKQEWNQHKDMFKEAMLHAFADELQKIASLGAIIGGAAGYKLSPNTAKGKLIGTLAGAGVGAATGGILGKAKRTFIDEPEHREQRELYSTPPVAGQSAPLGSNFY
jgi:hypothetical protein